jgi:hypothetical protein
MAGCHVAAHDWATWHQTTNQKLPRVAISLVQLLANLKLPHQHMPTQRTDMPHQHTTSATSASVRTTQSALIFFTYLAIRIDCDISLIRRPFEPK